MCSDFLSMERYIGPNAGIVHALVFESAICKIQDGDEDELDSSKKGDVEILIKGREDFVEELPEEASADRDNDDMYADIVPKKQRLGKRPASAYVNTKFLIPTSTVVERLFSLCKRVFSVARRRLQPQTLEMLVFLKVNREYWSASDVASVVNIGKDSGGMDSDSEDSDDNEYYSEYGEVIQ